ncbi:MAG: M15 family metallopeptidase [Cyanobacteria bacterium P01_D01_bin.1]
MSNLPILPPSNEIPPARRESTEVSLAEIESASTQQSSSKKGLAIALAILSCLGLGSIGIWQRKQLSPLVTAAAANTHRTVLGWRENIGKALAYRRTSQPRTGTLASELSGTELSDRLNESAEAALAATEIEDLASQPERLLNHRRYDIVDARKLVPLSPDSGILLQPDAQTSLEAMLTDAKDDGIQLGIISGFRTLEDQRYLYFDLKAERGESATTRAQVSAPPGYSEHHTGYAVDFIDESQPATHLEESFETTAAYQWLAANAPYYNFEMSFPKDNSANVAFEPWHWRYVGNQESLELFYK